MERAEHEEPDGESIPGHHELDNDPADDTGDDADVPKPRSRKATRLKTFVVLLISAAVVGALAFFGTSAGEVAAGGSSIPVEKSAVFDSPPSLEAPILDGWGVTDSDDPPTSVGNGEMRCKFAVKNHEVDPSEYDGEDRAFGDVAATESILSGMSSKFMQAIAMKQVGDFQKLNVPQASPGEPALEFITMRLDYLIPGTGEAATIRLGARSMASSGTALTTFLLCPTSVLEEGNDPWKALMANSIVVAGK